MHVSADRPTRTTDQAKMCYYDMKVYTCGDWKWDRFRAQCVREHRRGETCGLRMISAQIPQGTKCKICQQIEVKRRRRAAEYERLTRWVADGGKLNASIENARATIYQLDNEIASLEAARAYAAARFSR